MSGEKKLKIPTLQTGVKGLDEILGGGLPEYSFNIIAGAPGGGKTTLAHQIVFANATPERPALFFTVMGEPALKMLRYQQQFSFFDPAKLNTCIRFINLSSMLVETNLNAVLEYIIKEVEASSPSFVVVDSFRALMRHTQGAANEGDRQGTIHRLALFLTTWQATTFLIGEYSEREVQNNPDFTVADGVIWLSQKIERNSIVRKLQVMKLRGQDSVPGLHTFRISQAGLESFPLTFGLLGKKEARKESHRLSCGVAEIDALLGGGIPAGDSMLIAGPSGSGKSLLGSNFIAEGLRLGEPGVVAVFEERPDGYVYRAASLGMDFKPHIASGMLNVLYLRPLDLSVDETVHEIVAAVNANGAKRLVIDSLAGLEMALAPGFKTDFRESLYRMIAALTRLGVTIVSTVEVQETFTGFPLSSYAISFLADDILRLRYVSINGQLRKVMVVIKMRSSAHSSELFEYQITPTGIVRGDPIRGFSGLTSGIPTTDPNAAFPEENRIGPPGNLP